ncbi:MAG: hypothetical protein V4537_14435 [Pseudomonadota bacterium]
MTARRALLALAILTGLARPAGGAAGWPQDQDARGFKLYGLPLVPDRASGAVTLHFITPGAGYLKSSGTDGTVTTSATIPFGDLTGVVGTTRTLTPDIGILLDGGTSTVDMSANRTIGARFDNSSITATGGGALQRGAFAGGDVTGPAGSAILTIGTNVVSNAKIRQGVALSVMGVAGNATANVADIQATGALQVLSTNAAGTALVWTTSTGAVWTTGAANRRVYLVDGVNGSDANACFLDGGSSIFPISGGTITSTACKTLEALDAKIPRACAGRSIEIIIANGGTNTTGTYTGGLHSFLQGVYGCDFKSPLVRGTGTNTTAGATAFAGDAADLLYLGGVTATGCNSAGYNPTGTPTTSVIQMLKVGGAAPALPAEPLAPLGWRIRFDSNTTTVALRNVARAITKVTSGTTITVVSALPATPAAGDVFYLEQAGVSMAGTTAFEGPPLIASPGLAGMIVAGILINSGFNTSNTGIYFSFSGVTGNMGAFASGVASRQLYQHMTAGNITAGGGLHVAGSWFQARGGFFDMHNMVAETTITLNELSFVNWKNGSVSGTGVTIQGTVGTDSPTITSIGSSGAETGHQVTRVLASSSTVGAGIAINNSHLNLGNLDITNAGARPAILCLWSVVNQLAGSSITGSTGNSDVGVAFSGQGGGSITNGGGSTWNTNNRPIANTVTGTLGDVRVETSATVSTGQILTWAQADSGALDALGNRIIGSNTAWPIRTNAVTGTTLSGGTLTVPNLTAGGHVSAAAGTGLFSVATTVPGSDVTLTATQVAFGSVSNTITSSASMVYDATAERITFNRTNVGGNGVPLVLNNTDATTASGAGMGFNLAGTRVATMVVNKLASGNSQLNFYAGTASTPPVQIYIEDADVVLARKSSQPPTTTTTGMVWFPQVQGPPTGVPSTGGPLNRATIIDDPDKRFYAYLGSAWHYAAFDDGNGAAAITSLTTDVVATGPGAAAATIQAGVVTNAKLANMTAPAFKGRTTAGSGPPEDLTAAQATAMLNVFGAAKGLVPLSPGGTTLFLTADGTWAVPPGSGTSGITELTGDGLAGPGSGAQAFTLVNIPSGTTAAGRILATAIAAPSTPAAGKAQVYVDSTSKNLVVKDDAGTVKHGVQTAAGATHQFATAISDAGLVSLAQPVEADVVNLVTDLAALAPVGAHYVTNQAEAGLTNEVSLGALTSGVLMESVTASVATPTTYSVGNHGIVFGSGTNGFITDVPQLEFNGQTLGFGSLQEVQVYNASTSATAFAGYRAGTSSGFTHNIGIGITGTNWSGGALGTEVGLIELNSGANPMIISNVGTGKISFTTTSSRVERMEILTGGDVTIPNHLGVGTTGPTYSIDVAVNTAGVDGLRVTNANTASHATVGVYDGTGGGFFRAYGQTFGVASLASKVAFGNDTGNGGTGVVVFGNSASTSGGAGSISLRGGGYDTSAENLLLDASTSYFSHGAVRIANGIRLDTFGANGLLKNINGSDVVLATANVDYIATSRSISTTSPITGGGDLSANRTLGFQGPSSHRVYAGTASGTDIEASDELRIDVSGDRFMVSDDGALAWMNMSGGSMIGATNYERIDSAINSGQLLFQAQAAGTGNVNNLSVRFEVPHVDLCNMGCGSFFSVQPSGQLLVQGSRALSSALGAVADPIDLSPVATVSGSTTITEQDGVHIHSFSINTAANVTTAVGLKVERPSIGGGGAITNDVAIFAAGTVKIDAGGGNPIFDFPSDATGNTSAAVGRVLINIPGIGAKYLRYYND